MAATPKFTVEFKDTVGGNTATVSLGDVWAVVYQPYPPTQEQADDLNTLLDGINGAVRIGLRKLKGEGGETAK